MNSFTGKKAEYYKPLIMKYHKEYPKLKAFPLAKLMLSHNKLDLHPNYLCSMIKHALSGIHTVLDTDLGTVSSAPKVKPNFNITINHLTRDELPDVLDIPPGSFEGISPYVLPEKDSKILVVSDIHIPYHVKEHVELAFNYGKKLEVDTIIFNGDLFDFYAISRWDKNPSKKLLKREIDCGILFLESVRRVFKDQKIIFKIGNHEDRWTKYIQDKAPEIFNLDQLQFKEILRLKEFNIELVESSQLIKCGELNILHGHEHGGGGGGVNLARAAAIKYQANTLFGHFHKKAEYRQRRVDGSEYRVWATGALCDMQQTYCPYNQWTSGFAIVHLKKDGRFIVENKEIVDGEIY